MGGNSSQPSPSPSPPSPLLDRPWRDLPDNNQEILSFLKNYQPGNREFNHLRILLHGQIGAGKSSFINSVDSVLQGRIAGRAPTDAISEKSFTKKYKTYKIRDGPDNFYSFVFNDIMGYDKAENSGVDVEEVKLALKGHMAENHEFNPRRQLVEGDPNYNSSPTQNDKVQVLVCVIPVDHGFPDAFMQKLRNVRLAASDMGIPQMAILTRVDEACPEAKRNIKNVYKSIYLKELVERCHLLLGLPQNCIFLVKNYTSEIQTNDETDALILSALRQMVTFGDDYIRDL